MYKTDIHIFGCHERDEMIAGTQAKLCLPSDHIHYDDRPTRGCVLPVAKKAWLAPIPEGITHRMVLADDAEVCNGFTEICEQMVEAHPEAVISLFPFDFMQNIPCVDEAQTPYFECRTLSGVAIIMPVKYIEPCFEFTKAKFDDNCHDDVGIADYCCQASIEMLTTVPATVQHIGDDSVLFPGAAIRRTVYYAENLVADWKCRTVAYLNEKEWFFSNGGRRRPGNIDYYLKYKEAQT